MVLVRLDFPEAIAFERMGKVLPLPKDCLIFVQSSWLACPYGNTFSRLDFVPLGDYWATEIDSMTEQFFASENAPNHPAATRDCPFQIARLRRSGACCGYAYGQVREPRRNRLTIVCRSRERLSTISWAIFPDLSMMVASAPCSRSISTDLRLPRCAARINAVEAK
ncbi:hypothetical protein Q31a_05190 [Aureliella helgolandensis]|uniref:Uncharacterized protein n=1 Tax=Aureliella helgolandensis TaxID=2527968 RepID=A0A518G0V2_9BACT|nr:hypothetical protein Q31a_05190 [Aureliella helgolandensis]